MRYLVLIITYCSLSFTAFAQTQADLNDRAAREYQKVDKELNSIYLQIIKNNKDDTAFIRNLKNAQRLWVQFRDAEMLMKYPDREPGYYGSIFPLCWSMYLTDLTKARIKTLKQWVAGEAEGDGCGGTVPVKQ